VVTHLALEVLPDTAVYIEEQLCSGEVYSIGDQEFSESGIYELSLMSVSGCDSIIVADLEFIEIDTTFIDEILCYGNKYELEGEVFYETGVYSLNLVSDFGCDSTLIIDLEFIEIDSSVSKDGSVLIAYFDTSYSYQWFDCNTNEDFIGATANIFEPDYSGDFAVRIGNNLGCESTSLCYYVVATGLKTIVKENELVIMPNPTKGLINIYNKTGEKIESVELYSLSGQFMKKYYLDEDNSFNILGYSEGIYLIKISVNNKNIVRRIALIK
jgi:hypothetical protein